MKPYLHSRRGNIRFGYFFHEPIFAWLVLLLPVVVLPAPAMENTNVLEIKSVTVSGKSLQLQDNENIGLGPFPENIAFGFGPGTNAVESAAPSCAICWRDTTVLGMKVPPKWG